MRRLFIDVREPNEFAAGHIEGAINIPPAELLAGTKKLDGVLKDAELVLYCLSGSRSNASIQILKDMGYTHLVNGINKSHVKAKYGL